MRSSESIEKELNECKGYVVNKRLVSLTNSLLIYQANVNQLKLWYQKNNDPHAALTIWNPDNYTLMEQVNLEMQRLFSNFLSSAYSLRDHLYTMKNEYYIGTVIEERMTENIEKYFKANDITKFIQDFRNLVIHCGFPAISKRLSISNRANDILFDKVQLYKFNGWSAQSKKFLETISNQVKLIDIVTDYDRIINEYYSEIIGYLKEYHFYELKELKEIKNKYNLNLHMVRI